MSSPLLLLLLLFLFFLFLFLLLFAVGRANDDERKVVAVDNERPIDAHRHEQNRAQVCEKVGEKRVQAAHERGHRTYLDLKAEPV